MGHGVKVIEIFKFCLCVSIPIGMSVIYADSDLMHKLGESSLLNRNLLSSLFFLFIIRFGNLNLIVNSSLYLVRRYKFIEYPKADTITKEDVAKALADMKKEAR